MRAFGRDEDTAAGGPTAPDVPPAGAVEHAGTAPGAPTEPATTDPTPAEPATAGSRPAGHGPAIPRTRAGGLWVAVAAFGVVLLFLLIFILQNLQVTSVHFLGARWRVPVGAALLLAAVAGILLAAMAGTARIIQLRLLARRRAGASRPQPPGMAVTRPDPVTRPDAVDPADPPTR